ncbi:N-acyl-D-amino-acid deacylase family protein [Paraburkholderia phytofirmans]|uniref:D-aminoacylase domain protein n=2 Tax=Paraburkholderia phytofirmans TaxID=261302 RepID=B2T6T0_PARPJ|nr:D-aminoacylase [Paraburkholderia phytofirmans]ACD18102.1 D-aminoacylase domain protein [Paraburkholderia phytofirmans PsJN]
MSVAEDFDLLIVGGTVIDGTRRPRYEADVGIRGGRIVAIGNLRGQAAKTTLDASGKIVSPGFIDSHTHDDAAVLRLPSMDSKVSQGVTTVVTGNCGVSIAPLRADSPVPAPLNLLVPEKPQDGTSFQTFSDYVEALRAAPCAVNVAPMVGHTTLRARTMADLSRTATSAEISDMRELLTEALNAGALGISTGTAYPPAAAATTEEVIEVCRPLTGTGAVYATHMRNEADSSIESLEETFAIGKALDVKVVVSHHKLMREQNFGKSTITLPFIRAAMKCQCVALDCYPYNASSTMLHLAEDRLTGKIRIASSGTHPELVGRELGDIAEEWGVSRSEASKRLQPASAIYFSMDEHDVQRILAFDETMIGSDGLPTGENPHPRLWGTFPRVLGHYSRTLGLFSLETAVWKMTGLTAQNFGIEQRGILEVGNHADVVVFDPNTVLDRATYDNPKEPADGIDYVIVNGTVTWQQRAHLGARNGTVITRTKR